MTLLEGYIAKLKTYPEDEVKIRVARPHILSPSKELLEDYKNGKINWKQYERRFRNEIKDKPEAIELLKDIRFTSMIKDVRLICYEKNPPCHRFILIEMIKEYQPAIMKGTK